MTQQASTAIPPGMKVAGLVLFAAMLLVLFRGCFEVAPRVASVPVQQTEVVAAAVPAPFTQQQRQEFAGQLREVLDLSERVMALAQASVQMTSRVNAVEQMRLARARLMAVGDRIPKAPASEPGARELANQADAVVAVRFAAAGYWLDYLDDGKPSQAADARQRGARAEQLARELREQLQVWQPAAGPSP